jgi:hypothetical protein
LTIKRKYGITMGKLIDLMNIISEDGDISTLNVYHSTVYYVLEALRNGEFRDNPELAPSETIKKFAQGLTVDEMYVILFELKMIKE